MARAPRQLAALLLLLVHLTVTLAEEPHLKVLPDGVSQSVGKSVYISCTAQVTDLDLVTEMHWAGPQGRPIPNPDRTLETIEDGPGNLGLYIHKLKEQDTGHYNCTAVYAGNQNLHASVYVNSYVSIDFGDTSAHQTPIIGTDALIRCTVTSKPSPLIDWLKDGQHFTTDERHIIQQDGIMIRNIQESDEGVYRCRARVASLAALEVMDIQVEVHVRAEIITPPEDISGVEKEAVTFQCIAKGKPAPTYSWVDEESLPLDGRDGYYVDDGTGELTILDLRPDQAGTYRCTASNPAGDDTAEAKLRVLTKPKLEQFLNITVDVTANANFRCVFSGDPKPDIIFQKETSQTPYTDGVNADDRIMVTQSIDENGHSVGVMKIHEVVREDDGLYTCTGLSTGGDTVGWGHITVQFPPTFERQPTNEFWSWEQEQVNLTCLATSIPNATIQWYLRNQEIPSDDLNLRVMALGPVGVLQVTPLDNSYFGTYTCQATNTLGTVNNDLTLKQVHTPDTITSAQVSKITATTITWTLMLPVNNGGRPITVFLVEYKMHDMSWDNAQSQSWTKGSSYTLDGLSPQMRYTFRFAAKNEVGISEWSGEKTEQMPEVTTPEEPLIFVRGDGVNFVPYTDHYDLQWKTPLDNGDPIDYSTVIYYQVVQVGEAWDVLGTRTTRQVEYPGPTTYTLDNLRPDTHYRIELRAHNSIGFSSPAELVIKTANDPSAPSSDSSVGGRSDTLSSDAGSTTAAPYTEESMPVGVVVGILVVALLVLAVLTDVMCFFCKDAGVTAALVHKVGGGDDKQAEKNTKLKSFVSLPNGASNGEEKLPVTESRTEDKKEPEPTESTPMIQGEGGDKDAILKEEQEAAKEMESKGQSGPEAITKDSPV